MARIEGLQVALDGKREKYASEGGNRTGVNEGGERQRAREGENTQDQPQKQRQEYSPVLLGEVRRRRPSVLSPTPVMNSLRPLTQYDRSNAASSTEQNADVAEDNQKPAITRKN